MNIAHFLTKAARVHGDHMAVGYGDRRYTYREFDRRVGQLAGALLSCGLGIGDRVVLVQRNAPELLESLFAVFRAGLTAVPVNNRLHPREVAFIVVDSGAKAMVYTPEFAASAQAARQEAPALVSICTGQATESLQYESILNSAAPTSDAEVAPDAVAWLFYTSGTTGRPKGAMLTHRNLVVMTMNYYADICPAQPEDVFLHAAPLTHGSGLYALPALAKGAANWILESPSFEPEAFLRTIQERRVTQVPFLVPTMITLLLNSPTIRQYDLSSLRCIAYGGGPMYLEDLKRAISILGPVFVQLYGQGEAPMTISYLRREEHVSDGSPARERRLAACGMPRTDVEVRVLDTNDREVAPGEIGEICVRGDIVMTGYWNRPEATAETLRGGWLHTGDLGKRDAEGYLYLLDRAKDMIISGGSNIYPREVEEVILRHPAVYEAAVIGVPDPVWGEAVKAVVVLREGLSAAEEEIIQLCKDNLASYKKPKSVEFVSALPKSAYGKILKRELRDRYWQGRERKI